MLWNVTLELSGHSRTGDVPLPQTWPLSSVSYGPRKQRRRRISFRGNRVSMSNECREAEDPNVLLRVELTKGDRAVTKVRETTHVAKICATPRFSNTCTAKSRRHRGTLWGKKHIVSTPVTISWNGTTGDEGAPSESMISPVTWNLATDSRSRGSGKVPKGLSPRIIDPSHERVSLEMYNRATSIIRASGSR